jgi:hypothetical protein
MLRNAFSQRRVQKFRAQVAVATKVCAVATNALGSTVRTLLLVTLLAPRILRRLLDFWKICVPQFLENMCAPIFGNVCAPIGRDSLVDIVTAWTIRGSNPGWGGVFCTRSNRPWDPPSLVYNGSRVFHGGKAAGTWRWPPTQHLEPRLKKE